MSTPDELPDSTEPPDAAPRRRWLRWLPRTAFESALIVFSVLLALALSEWRDQRRTEQRSRAAAEAIVAELRTNREAALRAAAFHRSTHQALSGVAASGQLPPMKLVTAGLFNPANVIETAWVSARETDALDEWPYELTLKVSRVYERQAAYSALARQLAADVYIDLRRRGVGPVLQEGYGGFSVLAHDFANREDELVHHYDTALAAITGPR